MPKNDHAHALRLNTALRAHLGDEEAMAFAASCPLSKSASVEARYAWACRVADALAPCPDGAAIRRDCRCNDGRAMAQQISACIRKGGSLAAGCALFTEQNHYAGLEYVSEHELLFFYRACVCSCVKRAEGLVPLMWCECSAGYAESMFRQVFGCPVRVTLLESVKSGANRCTMRIEW